MYPDRQYHIIRSAERFLFRIRRALRLESGLISWD